MQWSVEAGRSGGMARGPEDFEIAQERMMRVKRRDGEVGEEIGFLFLNHHFAARCRLDFFDVRHAAAMGQKQGSDAASIAQPGFGFGGPSRAVDEQVALITQ